MYAMERLSRYIAQGVYSVSNPFHPFGGAVDIVVVQQQDGTFKSSPWYVKFGKFQGVLKAKEKIVAINVNGIEAEFHMMLSHKGEAYFLLEMDDDTQEQSSEDDIIQHSCNIAKEKEPIVVENSQILNSVSQIGIKTRNTGTGTSSSRSKFFKLMFGREGDKTDDSNIQRNSSLDRAEIAANLLEMKWTTNISMKNIETHDDCSSGETFASEARGADNAYLSTELSDNDSIGKQYNPTDANVASLKGKLHDKLEESVTSYDIKKSASESLLDRRLYSESHVTGCHDKKQTFEEKYCVSMLGPSDGYCNMNKICTKTFLRTSKNSSTRDPIFDGEILESSNLCHNLRMGEGLDNGCESKVLPGCTNFRQSLENENFTESGNRISQKSINDINISEESPSFHFLSKMPCVDQMEFVDYHKKERNLHEIDLKPNEVQSVKECSISYNPDFMQKDKLQSENLNNFVPNEVQLEYPSFTDSCDILQLEYPRFTDSSDVQSVKKGLESHDAHHEIYLSSNPYIEAQPALETVMNPVGILRENKNINYPNSINMSQKQTLIGKFQRSLPNLQILNHELESCDTHSSRKSFDSNSEYLSCNTNRDDVSSSSGKTTSIHEKEKLPDLIQIKDFAKIIESWDTEKNQFVANDTAVEVSLCRSLLYKGMGAEAASKAFDSEKLDLSMFATLEPSSLGNKQLILRIGGCYYPFNATLPFIFGKMSLDQVKAFNPESPIVEGVEEPLEGHISTHVVASNGSWKLWPFNFRKSKTIGARDLGMKISEVDESSKSIKDGRKDNKVQKAPVKRKLKQSFIPTSEQLASLNLNEGKNVITFAFSTTVLGHQQVDARIYLWKWNTRIVVSDVDGTITKSDVLGQFMPLVGRDWSQIGVTRLFSSIKENGYELLFLSARSIFQAYLTRQFLLNLKQDGMVLPDGPVVISPDGLFPSLYREVIRRAPHEFKISCLEVIRSLFPSDHNPFYAGFGNRETDEISYLKIGIPQGKIFTINPKGEVAVDRSVNTKSYYSFHSLVNDMFPSMSSFEQEEFNSWNYWKLPLPNIGF